MMDREMEFRMERAGLIQEGDPVRLKEDTASTMAGLMYYYTIRDAVAMSNNTKKRLTNLEGTVKEIREEEGYWTVTVSIHEGESKTPMQASGYLTLAAVAKWTCRYVRLARCSRE